MPLSSCAPASANCPDELSTRPILIGACANAVDDAARAAASTSFFMISSSGMAILTPDFPCDLGDQLELAALVVLGQLVAGLAAGKAALRREANVFEWGVFGRLCHPLLESVLFFKNRRFRGHQPQNHLLAPGHEAQRLEGAL